jgi:hypothetical protein
LHAKVQKCQEMVYGKPTCLSIRLEGRLASSTTNKNQQAIKYNHRKCNKTHSSTFWVGTLALGDRRRPTLAAASASWAFFAVASSRCSLVQLFFCRRGLVAGLGRLRIGSAALLFAFLRGDDGGDLRLRDGDALSCLFGFGFLCAGYSRGSSLPRQTFCSVKLCTNFLTA